MIQCDQVNSLSYFEESNREQQEIYVQIKSEQFLNWITSDQFLDRNSKLRGDKSGSTAVVCG